MPPGPGPVAAAHRILIVSALVCALVYSVWEFRHYRETSDIWSLVRTGLGVIVSAGILNYLRTLHGLSAKLTPRDRQNGTRRG